MPHTERIDELLVTQGYSTHRSARRLLQSRTVTVNGGRVTDNAHPFCRRTDTLCIDGTTVATPPHVYLMLNKAHGSVCTHARTQHPSVLDGIPQELRAPHDLPPLHSVGRLDLNTEGLLLLTTDGKLSHRMTHPTFHVQKTYLVRLKTECGEEEREAYVSMFLEGMEIPPEQNEHGFFSAPARLEWVADGTGTACRLTLTEGKFHQVKRMFKTAGNEVVFLRRIAFAGLSLDGTLPPGGWRHLSLAEEDALFANYGKSFG